MRPQIIRYIMAQMTIKDCKQTKLFVVMLLKLCNDIIFHGMMGFSLYQVKAMRNVL